MTFSHRDSTYVRLGPVEAYAQLRRRVMMIENSAVVLSLHTADPANVPEALRAIKEGDRVSPSDLESIIPGLGDTPSYFAPATGANPNHMNTAITDGVVVCFSLDKSIESDPARAEAHLRGIHARFVVTMYHSSESGAVGLDDDE